MAIIPAFIFALFSLATKPTVRGAGLSVLNLLFVPEIRKAIYTDKYNRITEYDAQKGHQKSGDVPVGRSGFQDSVSRLEKYLKAMNNANSELERSDESIRDFI